ncbi:MAG: GLPGLI family protein [Siphonobacter sp.]
MLRYRAEWYAIARSNYPLENLLLIIWQNARLYFTSSHALYTEQFAATPKEGAKKNTEEHSDHIYLEGLKQFVYYATDLKNKTLQSAERVMSRPYPVIEALSPTSWKVTNERKKIGNYSCLKAVAQTRNRVYVAWFTPTIPVPYGPWKLGGLPGLILEVFSEDGEVKFEFDSFESGDFSKQTIPPVEKKVMSVSEFIDFRKKLLTNSRKSRSGSVLGSHTSFTPNTFSLDKYPN